MRSRALLALSIGSALVPPSGCEASALGSHEHIPKLRSALESYGITPTVAATEVADLRWHSPPADCKHAYRISIEYEPDIMFEPDSVSTLVTGPPRKPKIDHVAAGGELLPGTTFAGQAYYLGYRAEKRGVFRDWYLSAEHAGPAAPTAACLPRTWDPVEDALALAWPRLPARLTAVDESWTGLRVEGKCNRSACVIPETGGGGADAHDLPCVTMSWHTELAGIYEVGDERLALVRSEWTDGHEKTPGLDAGIDSELRVVVSLEHGRPVWAELVVDHRFAQATEAKTYAPITRRWTFESIDDCPGSLASLGWDRPAEVVAGGEDALTRMAAGEDGKTRRTRSPDTTPSPME